MIASDLSLNQTMTLTRRQALRVAFIAVGFTLALALVFAFQPFQESFSFEPGQVSPRTILAPERVTYVSDLQLNEARDRAQAQVKDIYDPPDANLAREQVRWASRVLDYVDTLRHDPFSSLNRKIEWVRAIPTITLSAPILGRTLALDETAFHRIVSETLYVVDLTMRDAIHPDNLASEYDKIPARVSLALAADQAELVTQWTEALIAPNSFLNQAKTEEQRRLAREQVSAVYRTIEKGQAILREGEVITPLAIETLQATGFMQPRSTWNDNISPALLAVLLATLLILYILRLRLVLITHWRTLLLIAVVTLAFVTGIKMISNESSTLRYLFPISAAAMLIAVLVDPLTALVINLILGLSFGFLMHNSFEFVLYGLAGGTIAALSLGRIERLPAFLWSGAYVAAANAAVVAIFRALGHETNIILWGQLLLAALGNGALSGLIALGSVFILGKLFSVTTSLELMDLARPTHPLLTKLFLQAPGTYHHSLIVGQLAERAAHRIGADALLVRVAANYHDIGKIVEPQSFVENQINGFNIHDTLTPQQSATVVIDHVARGLALAKQYGLPERLREFIPQHHGTTLAAYFHRKALRANYSTPIDEKDFRYPGPKPQSRETAILMLADGVEATTRAERPTSPEQIHAIIDRIVNERLRDGQLDDSELTLHDLQQIKEAFFSVLQGLFHPRIRYPEPLPPPEKTHER